MYSTVLFEGFYLPLANTGSTCAPLQPGSH